MSETMRAVLIKDGKGPVENLYLGEAPKPSPEPNEVLVKIKAFGLNRMDIVQRLGFYPVPAGASPILGVEFSGTVEDAGSQSGDWKVGDEVLGLASGGAYAEYIVLPGTHLLHKPKHLSWVEAASIPENFLTAFQALFLVAEFKRGESAMIHAGASGVGVAAIQLCRYIDASSVTATASTPSKLSWLLSMNNGATHAANYKSEDFSAVAKTATNGKGVDVIVDPVGQSHWHKNIDSLAMDGRMTLLAFLSGAEIKGADLQPILYKRLRIQGSTLRSRSVEYQANLIQRFEECLGDITGEKGDGRLKTYIHEVFPWQDIQKATMEMEADKNSGKIIVEIV